MRKAICFAMLAAVVVPSYSADYGIIAGKDSLSLNAFPTEHIGVSVGFKSSTDSITRDLAGSYDPDAIPTPTYTSLGRFNSSSSTSLSLLYRFVNTDRVGVFGRFGYVAQQQQDVKSVDAPYSSTYLFAGSKKTKSEVSGGIGITYRVAGRVGIVGQYDTHLGVGVGVAVGF